MWFYFLLPNTSFCFCFNVLTDPWVRKIFWRRAWQPTPVFLPGESHGQRSQLGYSPRGCKKLDTAEQLTLFSRCKMPNPDIHLHRCPTHTHTHSLSLTIKLVQDWKISINICFKKQILKHAENEAYFQFVLSSSLLPSRLHFPLLSIYSDGN